MVFGMISSLMCVEFVLVGIMVGIMKGEIAISIYIWYLCGDNSSLICVVLWLVGGW